MIENSDRILFSCLAPDNLLATQRFKEGLEVVPRYHKADVRSLRSLKELRFTVLLTGGELPS